MSRRATVVLASLATCVVLAGTLCGCSTAASSAPPKAVAAGHMVAPAKAPADAPKLASVGEGQRSDPAPGTAIAFDERTLRTLPRAAEGGVIADVVSVEPALHRYTLRVVSFGLRMPTGTAEPGVALYLPAGSLLVATVAGRDAQAGAGAKPVDTALLRTGDRVALKMKAGARAGAAYVEIVSVAKAPAGRP